ncbi:HIRAN domain-containing protein [Cereibacter sediminicola]|uniref:HIRAN domain-containing protein n=1 Tax=Cereibacter sediminicola TaxID=2584941 RepID=UPI001FE995DB|nr:HIRAN domain-containing protein [Cereibacter sediminicola]
MDRRHLLLAGGGALAALPLAAAPRASGGIPVLETYIASRDRFPGAQPPRPGELLRLRRDPGRGFDPRSVRVERTSGEALGYLPGQPVQILAALMDRGAEAHALAGDGGGLRVYLHLPQVI